MLFKRTPFASQMDSICMLKGLHLECKRTTFGMQKDYIFGYSEFWSIYNRTCESSIYNISMRSYIKLNMTKYL